MSSSSICDPAHLLLGIEAGARRSRTRSLISSMSRATVHGPSLAGLVRAPPPPSGRRHRCASRAPPARTRDRVASAYTTAVVIARVAVLRHRDVEEILPLHEVEALDVHEDLALASIFPSASPSTAVLVPRSGPRPCGRTDAEDGVLDRARRPVGEAERAGLARLEEVALAAVLVPQLDAGQLLRVPHRAAVPARAAVSAWACSIPSARASSRATCSR